MLLEEIWWWGRYIHIYTHNECVFFSENKSLPSPWWMCVCLCVCVCVYIYIYIYIYIWRRQWQPTPVFLPGESQDGGAWWAAVYGVTQSWTRLKRFSILSIVYIYIKKKKIYIYIYIFPLCGASLYDQVNPCPWDSYIKLESPLLLTCLAKPSPMKHKRSLAWDTI